MKKRSRFYTRVQGRHGQRAGSRSVRRSAADLHHRGRRTGRRARGCVVALLRADPLVYGPVASDPTVSRTIDVLPADAPTALTAINSARAAVWSLAGKRAPDHAVGAAAPLVFDIDATLVTSHSEKEQAAPSDPGRTSHPNARIDESGPPSRLPMIIDGLKRDPG